MDRGKQRCVYTLNKGAAKLAKTQAKENSTCVKNATRGKVADLSACLIADLRGKVAKAKVKLTGADQRVCTDSPDFGYAGASAANTAVVEQELGVITDLFGSDPSVAVISAASDSDGAACQSSMAKGYEKIVQAQLKLFNGCKKKGMADGSVASEYTLSTCFDTVRADDRGKVAKAVSKLDRYVATKCSGVDMAVAFPGVCAGAGDFSGCVGEVVGCRVCQILKAVDAMNYTCDAFDDGEVNGSCIELPSTSTTSTTTTTLP
jgi:hypothetical protein